MSSSNATLQFWEIFASQSPDDELSEFGVCVCVCVFFFFFLSVVCESKSLFPRVWQQKDWLAISDRGLYNKTVLLGITLPKDKISKLQGVMLKYFIFRKHTVNTLLYQSRIFSRSNQTFAILEYLFCYQLWVKRSRSQVHWVFWNYVRR